MPWFPFTHACNDSEMMSGFPHMKKASVHRYPLNRYGPVSVALQVQTQEVCPLDSGLYALRNGYLVKVLVRTLPDWIPVPIWISFREIV
jgi:hypothetical protein